MGRIERSAAARADLIHHFVDLAEEASEATAHRFLDRAEESLDLLGDQPEIGALSSRSFRRWSAYASGA